MPTVGPSRPTPALPQQIGAVLPLLFLSGVSALVYQIAWQREFRLIFGASTAATAAVLAVFMGGLGLGGLVLGPRSDRKRNPLAFYGLLEAGVALTAAVTPFLLDLARGAYLRLGGTIALGAWGGTALRLLLTASILGPATFLAGGTLGAAARAVESDADRGRRATALLYGVNALGAVAGCLIATFWWLEAFGTRATLWLAALANLAVAGAALWLSRGREAPVQEGAAGLEERAARAPARFVLAAAGVTGFAFFLMELVWYRLLAPILGGTVYTFGLVLAVALFGLAAGGALYTALGRRVPIGLPAFAATALLEAGSLAIAWALGDRIAILAFELRPPAGSLLAAYLPGWAIVTAVLVLPASIVAGAQFPLLVALLGQGRTDVARHLGQAYLWNTVGAIGGALAGGFGLMPALTAPGCWQAVVLLLVALALAALLVDGARRPEALPLAAVAGLMIGLLLLADGPTAAWRHGSIGVGRATEPLGQGPNPRRAWINELRRSIVWEQEGVESSVALQAQAGLSFVVNGKVDGNARNDAPTQVMSGMLDALLHPETTRALVVGLGTGSTAGWLGALPGMRRVDVVELEPAILEVARRCAPVNREVMDQARVNVILGDAREVLMVSRERYGLVFSEPSNPYRAGVASLFTREFYRSVAQRLDDDGLFIQWVQAYEVDRATVETIIATLADVFPEVEVWQSHQLDLLLVASRHPRQLFADELRARLREQPLAAAAAAAWRADSLEDVLARYVAGPELCRRIHAQVSARNRDDRNLVEFSFAKTLSRQGLFEVAELRRSAAEAGADRPDLEGEVNWSRVRRQRLAIYTIAGAPAPPQPDAEEGDRLRAQAHASYLAGRLSEAVTAFRAQPAPPEGMVETTIFAEGLADAGDPQAAEAIRALDRFQPTEAAAATARLAFRLGQRELARNALVSAFVSYRSDPWPSQVAMVHALGLAVELTVADPEAAPALFEALGQPFAVAALEEPRTLVRLQIAGLAGLGRRCYDALLPFEQHVAWREDVLRMRVACYAELGDRRAAEARRDLEQFLSAR